MINIIKVVALAIVVTFLMLLLFSYHNLIMLTIFVPAIALLTLEMAITLTDVIDNRG